MRKFYVFAVLLLFLVGGFYAFQQLQTKNELSRYVFTQEKGGVWELIHEEAFETVYKTIEMPLQIGSSQDISIRLEHRGGKFADIEYVALRVCGELIAPERAFYTESGEDILRDLIADDLNVALAHEKEIELRWKSGSVCNDETAALIVKANQYEKAVPFDTSYSGPAMEYTSGLTKGGLQLDGILSEEDNLGEALYVFPWVAGTGHPTGDTYVYMSEDEQYLYVGLDITMDNSNEFGQDWVEFNAHLLEDKKESFKIDDYNDEYGLCGFGESDKVSYRHQMCEFKIPLEELPSENFAFSLRYYGTGGAATDYSDAIYPQSSFSGLFAVKKETAGDVFAAVRNIGGGINTDVSGNVNDDQVFGVSSNSNSDGVFIVYGEDDSGSASYDLKMSFVTDTGVIPGAWPVTISALGGVGNFHAENQLLRMEYDEISNGVFVLYREGAESGFGIMEVFLRYYDEFGAVGFTTNLGQYNADMIQDTTNGGVFVLSDIGEDRESALPLGHGVLRRFTSTGADAAWAGGTGSVVLSTNVTSLKQGSTLFFDDNGGFVVLWNDDQAGEQGIYAQHFSEAGVQDPTWSARGEQIHASTTLDAVYYVRGLATSLTDFYAAFKEAGDIKVIGFDNTAAAAWGCVQTFTSDDNYALLPDSTFAATGVFVVSEDGGSAYAQRYSEATGERGYSDLPGVEVATGSDFEMVLTDGAFPHENKSSGATRNNGSTAVDLLYITSDPGSQTVFNVNFDSTTYPAGPGGDCAPLAVAPDAPVITVIAGNEEIQIDFPAPADNGSALTQYEVRVGETAGFPGNEVTTIVAAGADPVSVIVPALTNGTPYSARVFATNAAGLSPASNVATATPIGSGRRRTGTVNSAANVYLGTAKGAIREAQILYKKFLHQAASLSETLREGEELGLDNEEISEAIYQSLARGEESRKFSEDEGLISRLSVERRDILTLLDLLSKLRHLYSFMQSDTQGYQVTTQYQKLSEVSRKIFMERNFLHVVGVRYFAFDTEFREDLSQILDILVDWEKALVIKFGQVCYQQSEIDYMTALDYPDSPNWFHRYKEKTRDWARIVLLDQADVGPGFVDWLKVDDKIEDPLKAYYQYVFGFCLSEALENSAQ